MTVEEALKYNKVTSSVSKNELCKFFPDMSEDEIKERVMIADTGASTNMSSVEKGFGKVQKNTTPIRVAEGSLAKAPIIGDWHGKTIDGKTGKEVAIGSEENDSRSKTYT